METDFFFSFSSLRKSYAASDVTPIEKKDLFSGFTGIESKPHILGLMNNASYKDSAAALKVVGVFCHNSLCSLLHVKLR